MSHHNFLVTCLQPGNPEHERVIAAEGLRGSTEASAIEALQQALVDGSPQLRFSAARALAEGAANLALAAANAVLEDPELARRHGVALLGQLVRAAEPGLNATLAEPGDALARCQAAGIIAALPYQEAIKVLRDHLDGEDHAAMFAAALLAAQGDERAVDRLVDTLANEGQPEQMRWIAARALIHIDNKRAHDALADALSDASLVDLWAARDPAEMAILVDLAAQSLDPSLRNAAEAARKQTLTAIAAQEEDGRPVAEVVSDLLGPDADARNDAIETLVAMHPDDVVPALLDVVAKHAADGQTRLTDVVYVLREFADARSTAQLIGLAANHDWTTRQFTVEALGKIADPSAAQTICDALTEDPSEQVRRAAANVIHRFAGHPAVQAAVVRAVLDEPGLRAADADFRVARPAGHALGVLALREAVPDLRAGIDHPLAPVRRSAAWAIGELRALDAYDELVRRLVVDDVAYVRRACAWALGRLGNEMAGASLTGALKDEDADVRDNAAFALGELKYSDAVPALIGLADSEPVSEIRARVIWALGEIRDLDALELLLRRMEIDSSADVRARCAWALGQIGAQRTAETILKLLPAEESDDVREAMVHALGELAWSGAAEDLERRVVADLAPSVQKASAQVLGRIGTASTIPILQHVTASAADPPVRSAARQAIRRITDRL